LVLDLDGTPMPVVERTDDSEMEVTIGADGFSYTRREDAASRFGAHSGADDGEDEFKLGHQLCTAAIDWEERTTMLDEATIGAIAADLARAERTGGKIGLLTAKYPDMTVEDSYAVQNEWRRRGEAAGRRLYGHKIGLTSKPMQQATGISEPDYGAIFADQV